MVSSTTIKIGNSEKVLQQPVVSSTTIKVKGLGGRPRHESVVLTGIMFVKPLWPPGNSQTISKHARTNLPLAGVKPAWIDVFGSEF